MLECAKFSGEEILHAFPLEKIDLEYFPKAQTLQTPLLSSTFGIPYKIYLDVYNLKLMKFK